MSPTKDDPIESTRPPSKVTLWLNRANMTEARENYKNAFAEVDGDFNTDDARVWDVAFAAAVAAIDYVMAGKVTPR